MNKYFIFFSFILIIFCNENKQKDQKKKVINEKGTKPNDQQRIVSLGQQFEALTIAIRDNKIEFKAALKEIQKQIPKIKLEYYKLGGIDWKKDS